MASNTHKNNDNANKVQNMFDQILCRHMERLIGTSYGIGALSMNSTTISCLMLLMERENEIENFPSDAQERYTAETLISELDEMSFSLSHNIKTIIEDMIRKDYINVDDHNKLIPDKPTISMAQLLDRTFPKMPGMNLVAYFIQTMDEVKSERKDLDSAISQFGQILQMQGVSLINEQSQTDTEKTSTPSVEQKTQLQKSEVSLKKGKGSDILGRLKPATWSKQSRVSPSESKILSSDAFAGKLEIREIGFGSTLSKGDESEEITSDGDSVVESGVGGQIYGVSLDSFLQMAHLEKTTCTLKIKVKDNDEIGYLYILEGELISAESGDLKNKEAFNRLISWENVVIEIENTCTKTENEINQSLMNLLMEGLRVKDEKKVKEGPEPTSGELIEDEQIDFVKETEEEVNLFAENEAHPIAETNIDSATTSETDVFDKIDEDIEKRIVAFEDDLSMECPMCKNAKIMSEQTSKGKLYYRCSNKTCIFISWGKPYHIVCPKCNNPFLAEVSGKSGRSILKCPRATCRHWQKLSRKKTGGHQKRVNSGSQTDNGVTAVSRRPRRKVVRKRRVRRKK